MQFIIIVFWSAAIYLFCGLVFTIVFITKGINAIDEGAHGSGIGFRIIIAPGCMAFWPVLLKKWMKARQTSAKGRVFKQGE